MLWLGALVAVGVVLALWGLIAHSSLEQATPFQTFRNIYEAVSAYAMCPELIGTWDEWRAKAGADLKTTEDAVRVANEMLKPLNDPYTLALTTKQYEASIHWENNEVVGIGVHIATAYENTDVTECSQKSEQTGVSCQFPTIVAVINNSPAAEAGLSAGDLIVAIDGSSTENQPLSVVLSRLHGKRRQSVTLIVRRDSAEREVVLKRRFIIVPTASSRMLEDGIGYLRIAHFGRWAKTYAYDEAQRLDKAKAVALDLRNNPGGELPVALWLCALFLAEGDLVRMDARVIGGEGRTTKVVRLDSLSGMVDVIDGRPYPKADLSMPRCMFGDKPTVVLVNESTASAAELFTGALRDSGGATILGTRTFGKGVFQYPISIPRSNVTVRVTSGKFFSPKGDWAGDGARDKRGIEPHVVVPTPSKLFDFGSDGDLQLKAAVHLLQQKLSDGQ